MLRSQHIHGNALNSILVGYFRNRESRPAYFAYFLTPEIQIYLILHNMHEHMNYIPFLSLNLSVAT